MLVTAVAVVELEQLLAETVVQEQHRAVAVAVVEHRLEPLQ
jgi:hypothetical protein